MILGLYTPLTLWETVVCSIPNYGAVCLVLWDIASDSNWTHVGKVDEMNLC